MFSQERIIKALHENICPLCYKNQMVYQKNGLTNVKGEIRKDCHFITCLFCCNSWEITEKTANENVRICDTKSFKERMVKK